MDKFFADQDLVYLFVEYLSRRKFNSLLVCFGSVNKLLNLVVLSSKSTVGLTMRRLKKLNREIIKNNFPLYRNLDDVINDTKISWIVERQRKFYRTEGYYSTFRIIEKLKDITYFTEKYQRSINYTKYSFYNNYKYNIFMNVIYSRQIHDEHINFKAAKYLRLERMDYKLNEEIDKMLFIKNKIGVYEHIRLLNDFSIDSIINLHFFIEQNIWSCFGSIDDFSDFIIILKNAYNENIFFNLICEDFKVKLEYDNILYNKVTYWEKITSKYTKFDGPITKWTRQLDILNENNDWYNEYYQDEYDYTQEAIFITAMEIYYNSNLYRNYGSIVAKEDGVRAGTD